MKPIFFTIAILILPTLLLSQRVGENFYESTKKIQAHYDSMGPNKPGYKQFKRLEWYFKTRIGLDGNFVNNSQYKQEALVQTNYMTPAPTNRTEANAGAWNFVGPTNVTGGGNGIGRVNRITFHPTNASILFAASAGGGLWKTSNSGSSWACLTNGLPNINTSGVVIDYSNTNILYLLIGDGDGNAGGANAQFSYGKFSTGVLKSVDGGQTWFQTGLVFAETDKVRAYKIVMHPTNPNIIMVATSKGLYRTTTGGNGAWQEVLSFGVWDIEFKPGSPSTVFTATEGYLFKSTNDGAVFDISDATYLASGSGRTAIAVCPSNTNRVYILAGKVTDATHYRGFFRYNDADGTMTKVNDTPNILGRDASGNDVADQSGYDLAIVAKPDNSNYVITGGIREWYTTNGGTSFTFVPNTSFYHDDIHDLAYNPLDSKLYMCGDGGVYISSNNGTSWGSINNTLAVSQYYKIAVSETDEDLIVGGLQDNGTNRKVSNTSSFFQILGKDGMDCAFGNNNTILYASAQEGEFYRSADGGNSFTGVITPEYLDGFNISVGDNWLVPIAVHPTNNNIIFMSYTNALVKAVRNTTTGIFATITKLDFFGNTFVKVGKSNASRIYNASNARDNGAGSLSNLVKRSDDGGATFTTIRSQNRSSNPPVTDLSINPGNSLEIWLTYGGYTAGTKVFYSSDGGANFTNISGSLPNIPINTVVYAAEDNDANDPIYIGTDIGVFYKDNTLTDWVPYSNGLPVVEVSDIKFSPANSTIRIGTYGRGIWESSLYSTCAANVTLSTANQAVNTPYSYQASNSITSTANVFGTGAKVSYKAGSYVELKTGFVAVSFDEGTTFLATNGPCGGGVPFRLPNFGVNTNGKTGYLVSGPNDGISTLR